jgi:hypothetical protein
MSRKNKGKTWEEIYGIDGATKRREDIKKKKELGLLTKSTKGKTWEEIYSPEEVIRRKQHMKNNNPIHNMSEETAKNRVEKLKIAGKKYIGDNNPFYGKKHSDEFKKKLSETRKGKEWHNTVQIKINKIKREQHKKYMIVSKCLFCNKSFEHFRRIPRIFCSKQCAGYWNLINGRFKKQYPNSWEQKIIDLNISNLKYVGTHIFWITLHDYNNNDKVIYKNPDFIITPFSKSKKVIEVWGRWWHRNDNIEKIEKMYNNKNIEVLFLFDEDIKKTDEFLKNKIGGFINK